ncbi:MAG: bifunctional aminoglycoside phosphotransferase/ATP-binding protein [Panacagrimonas sp.]
MSDQVELNPLPTGAGAASFQIQSLLTPTAYPHPVADLRMVETHISWVLLTGSYAYKIKKPVNLGFLDFSTLALRHVACLEELRLNRRFAPELYLDVVPICGPAETPVIGGAGPVIEYAVKMLEFPQAAQLDRLLAAGQLEPADIEALATSIAEFHQAAPRASADGPYSLPEAIQKDAHDNLVRLLPRTESRTHERLETLARWTKTRGETLSDLMTARRRDGFVRELHGDLHLGNLARVGSRMLPFDCIEFSADFRWIDVISDFAFLTMDLQFRGRSDLAYLALNRYLESTGDYAGVPLLRYFEVYRALVRAKVALIRGDTAVGDVRAAQARDLDRYVRTAEQSCRSAGPAMILMHGVSGSGKTWLSVRLMTAMPAVRVRSDIERKRLHDVGASAASGSPLMDGLYSPSESARTYDHLAEVATAIVGGGENVIVDAAFLRRADRLRFRDLARQLDVPYVTASCHAAVAELDRRIAERMRTAADASEADRAVLDHQLATAEPLAEDELPAALFVETGDPAQVSTIIASLRTELLTDVAGADRTPSASAR